MKVFQGNTMAMAEVERQILTSLVDEGVRNIPSFQELHNHDDFSALVLTPVGVSVLPCPVGAVVTPSMLRALLHVVQHAHRLGWIHRDIKPDNIYLDHRDASTIMLNDWSSAARTGIDCDYVGTPIFGEKPGAGGKHSPDARLDLRSLVKTAFCLSKQLMPKAIADDVAMQQYWVRIQEEFPRF